MKIRFIITIVLSLFITTVHAEEKIKYGKTNNLIYLSGCDNVLFTGVDTSKESIGVVVCENDNNILSVIFTDYPTGVISRKIDSLASDCTLFVVDDGDIETQSLIINGLTIRKDNRKGDITGGIKPVRNNSFFLPGIRKLDFNERITMASPSKFKELGVIVN